MKLEIFNKENKVGIIDLSKNIILPAEYDNVVFDYQDEYALIKKDSKWGIISDDGKIICDCVYDTIHLDFSSGDYAAVANLTEKGNLSYGLINKKGKLVCKCKYDYIDSTPVIDGNYFVVGIYQEAEDSKQPRMLFGLIDCNGKIIQPCLFDSKDKAIKSVDQGLFKK